MSMTESNTEIIRRAYKDFANVFGAFDAGITWHVPGHSPLSGDYRGPDQIGGFFQRTMELSGGVFSIDVHNVLAEGDLVVCPGHSQRSTKRGCRVLSGSARLANEERKSDGVPGISGR